MTVDVSSLGSTAPALRVLVGTKDTVVWFCIFVVMMLYFFSTVLLSWSFHPIQFVRTQCGFKLWPHDARIIPLPSNGPAVALGAWSLAGVEQVLAVFF